MFRFSLGLSFTVIAASLMFISILLGGVMGVDKLIYDYPFWVCVIIFTQASALAVSAASGRGRWAIYHNAIKIFSAIFWAISGLIFLMGVALVVIFFEHAHVLPVVVASFFCLVASAIAWIVGYLGHVDATE